MKALLLILPLLALTACQTTGSGAGGDGARVRGAERQTLIQKCRMQARAAGITRGRNAGTTGFNYIQNCMRAGG